MNEIFHNVFRDGRRLFTVNLDEGQNVYGERLSKHGRQELREWNPTRSKLAAAIMNGLQTFPFTAESGVLYLGAAQGTTPSHVSDIVERGFVVCIELSQKTFEKLLPLCERRENMLPVLADANQPAGYAEYAKGCSVLYQDVAQPNQAAIFLKNFDFPGYGMLCIKSRSVDVAKRPRKVFDAEIETLKAGGLDILEVIPLEPFEKDHVMVVCRKH
jgi:fibrillarin-like pre-rRNA processing protein